ncbi:MAG: DUF4147 domain-containing protein [Pirellulaceae bacterium]
MRTLREDSLNIWHAAVSAVRGDVAVERFVELDPQHQILRLPSLAIDLRDVQRIIVVGAGKASGAMAAGLERVLCQVPGVLDRVVGWVNVPDGCDSETSHVHLHPCRPTGTNEPTQQAVQGAREIVRLVSEGGECDLCIALFSGGGSALLPAPVAGISLQDKIAVTRLLSGAGYDIRQLNAVRKPLSCIKGGKLLDTAGRCRLIGLYISDVLGDPLDVIASGPTVPDSSTCAHALAILETLPLDDRRRVPESVWQYLRRCALPTHSNSIPPRTTAAFWNFVIANNQTALAAATQEAARLGYVTQTLATDIHEPTAEEVGRRLADHLTHLPSRTRNCLLQGGEPVVRLVPVEQRGRGGRNQQLVLAATEAVLNYRRTAGGAAWLSEHDFALLSCGTDGEDGPTDAAGAVLTKRIVTQLTENVAGGCFAAEREGSGQVADCLQRNDAYSFWESRGGLIRSGPTGTNVCDVRVVLCVPVEDCAC